MDGLIIDSEPMWRKAYISVFGELGISLSDADCRSTTGMRVDEVIKHWAIKFPERNMEHELTNKAIIDYMLKLINEGGKPLPGVLNAIKFFNKRDIPCAIASASSYSLIHAVITKLDIWHDFSVIQSAENMRYGKPHPDVFIEAALTLKLRPEECLVFEDSVFGVIAAKAAKMKVVAIPDPDNFNLKGYCIADLKLHSLSEFNEQVWLDLITE